MSTATYCGDECTGICRLGADGRTCTDLMEDINKMIIQRITDASIQPWRKTYPVHTALGYSVPTPIDIIRVVQQDGEDDLHAVQISLTPHALREIVSAIGRALITGTITTHSLLAAGAPGIDGVAIAQSIADITVAPAWPITPEDADRLARRLDEASEEPRLCDRCNRFVELEGEPECSACLDMPGRW